jgi:hypothetical protein
MMAKKNSIRTLVIFWVIAIPLLIGWYLILNWKNDPVKLVNIAYNASRILPLGNKYDTALEIAHYILQKDDVERTYLILLQNNMELRPGGGYIGSFAIIKIKNGEIIDSAVHDTANFDGRIADEILPPYPMKETMRIPSWKLRDSNWLPDFPSNARVAENFYKLGGGEEEFDVVIALNASILDTVLAITGPIKLNDYPDVYKSGDAVMTLEYQVEQGYKEQGIKKGDRKVVMNDLADAIISHMRSFSLSEKISLAGELTHVLDSKDVQLHFEDDRIARLVSAVNWNGAVDVAWEKDYLMIVDANLAAYKTDHVMDRSVQYNVDLSGSIPQAVLTLHYENTATQKDWKTNDYQTYVRVYVPENSWFTDIDGCVLEPQYGTKFNKRYIGCLVHVPLGTSHDVFVRYNLPIDLKNRYPYDLKIQKQSGVHNIPVEVSLKNSGNDTYQKIDFTIDSDTVLSELK